MERKVQQTGTMPVSVRIRRRSLSYLSQRLNEVSSDYELMKLLVDGLTATVDARAGMIFLAAPTPALYASYRHDSPAIANLEETVRNDNHLLNALLAGRTSLMEREGVLFAPMYWQRELMGVLMLDKFLKTLAPQHRVGIVTLSNQAAAIIGMRKMLSVSSGDETTVTRQELEAAIAIQRSLLPAVPSYMAGLEVAAHTQPAQFVSGDYYDLIKVFPEKLGVVIADVEGKGMPGALFGNLLRSTVHFLTRELPSTAAVVSRINTILHKEASASRRLFTLFYALFDAQQKTMGYTGSGQIAPVLVREDGSFERLHSDGMPMGIRKEQELGERTVHLYKNDTVVFFTDGIVEARNRHGDAFSEERFISLLQACRGEGAEAIVQRTIHEVMEFSDGKPGDDLTLIVMRVVA